MGLFFKKKQKSETIKEERNTAIKINKHIAKTNGMAIKSEILPDGKTAYTIRYAIGDRKFTIDGIIDTEKNGIEPIDVGDVYAVLYNPEDPQDAVLENFQEL